MTDDTRDKNPSPAPETASPEGAPQPAERPPAEEIGGPQGAEPTRFGDWERGGRCSDF